MLRLEMLPARHGDALWLEYGESTNPRRLLIDGGPRSRLTTRRLAERLRRRADLELLVVTHIDADHISGILALLEDESVPISPRDVWFNGWHHLPTDVLGAQQGEALGGAIRGRRLPWNEDFDEGPAMVPDDGRLPELELADGLTLTLLSPTRRQLADLRPVWKREVEKAGLVPGVAAEKAAAQPDLLGDKPIDPRRLAQESFVEDRSEANGASLAMLAEFAGKKILLTGDAHGGVLAEGLRRLVRQRGVDTLVIDAFKLPHHGSKYNLSPEVLGLVECEHYLISTNGDIFRHPDPVAMSRIVVGRDEVALHFNYRSDTTERWASSHLQRRFRYRTIFPAEAEGLVVEF